MGLSMRKFLNFFKASTVLMKKSPPPLLVRHRRVRQSFILKRFSDKRHKDTQSGLAMRCFLQNILANSVKILRVPKNRGLFEGAIYCIFIGL
jgi:hypothetical protein